MTDEQPKPLKQHYTLLNLIVAILAASLITLASMLAFILAAIAYLAVYPFHLLLKLWDSDKRKPWPPMK